MSTPLSASLIQAAASDELPEAGARTLDEGDAGADREVEATSSSLIPLIDFVNGLEPFGEKVDGALAYLLFLIFFLVGEEWLEVEGDLGEARTSSLCRFFCGDEVGSDMLEAVSICHFQM